MGEIGIKIATNDPMIFLFGRIAMKNLYLPKIPVFPLDGKVVYTYSMQEVYDFSPEAIFVPGNIVPYYLPGVKMHIPQDMIRLRLYRFLIYRQ